MHHVINPQQPSASTRRVDKLKIREFRDMIIHAFEERLRFAIEKREPGHVPLQDRIPLGEALIESIRKGDDFMTGPYRYKMQLAAMTMDAAQLVEMANAVPEVLGRDRLVTSIEIHHLKPPAYQWMVHMTTYQKPRPEQVIAAHASIGGTVHSTRPAANQQSAVAESSRMRVA